MNPNENDANVVSWRVLADVVIAIQQRVEFVERERDRIIGTIRNDTHFRELVRTEAVGTVDGLVWAANRLEQAMVEVARRGGMLTPMAPAPTSSQPTGDGSIVTVEL